MLIVLMLKEICLMVKSSNLFFHIKIFFIFIFFITPFTLCADEVANRSNTNFYRVIKKEINILPIVPVSVLGLNAFLVNNNSENYFVTIRPKLENYNWLIDTIETKKDFYLSSDNVLPNISINMYLQEKIELIVNIKKLDKDVPNKELFLKAQNNKINLPYFIVVNNTKNSKTYLLREGVINVSLNNNKNVTSKVLDNIKIKFNQEDIENLEILTGFEQTKNQNQVLENYIKLQK